MINLFIVMMLKIMMLMRLTCRHRTSPFDNDDHDHDHDETHMPTQGIPPLDMTGSVATTKDK